MRRSLVTIFCLTLACLPLAAQQDSQERLRLIGEACPCAMPTPTAAACLNRSDNSTTKRTSTTSPSSPPPAASLC